MKSTARWFRAAAIAASLAAVPLFAADHGHGSGGHVSGSGGGHWSGGHGGSGWHGGHAGGWHGGYGGGWHGGWHSGIGFSFGVPLFWGPWWDPFYAPYGYGYMYPAEGVVYRERIAEPETMESVRDLPPAEGANGAPPAPAGNPMSANYCPSAKAYFPQVKTCPEGWKLTSPTS